MSTSPRPDPIRLPAARCSGDRPRSLPELARRCTREELIALLPPGSRFTEAVLDPDLA